MGNKIIPLSVPCFTGNELKYVSECIKSEWVSTAGEFVTRFENEFASYVRAKYAVACSNGTAALHISLLLAGVGQNDEVIVPTVTFISPVNTVKYIGAHPVFMDCDKYLNIDTDKVLKFCQNECDYKGDFLINKKTGNLVKAIIPVHVFGHPVEIEPLMEISKKYNLKIIEDATESLGSYYTKGIFQGKKTGTIGDFGCYSFNGNKIITTGGGGMLVTNKKELAERAKYLTTQAKDDPVYYVHNEIGYNYRMTNLQAALGVAQLEKIDSYIKIKRSNFNHYKKKINRIKGLSFIEEPDYAFSNFWMYSLIVDKEKYGIDRDELLKIFRDKKIQTRPLWKLNHEQKPFKNAYFYKIVYSKKLYSKILNIPCSIFLSEEDKEKVIGVLK